MRIVVGLYIACYVLCVVRVVYAGVVRACVCVRVVRVLCRCVLCM